MATAAATASTSTLRCAPIAGSSAKPATSDPITAPAVLAR